jgi:hypothetical protein
LVYDNSAIAGLNLFEYTMESLRVLLVGSGGREHAIAWKLDQSPRVEVVYVAPGNGGTASGTYPKVQNIHIKPGDFAGLMAFAKANGVNLVVPGPEAPLVDGIEGVCRSGKLSLFPLEAYSSFVQVLASLLLLAIYDQGDCSNH